MNRTETLKIMSVLKASYPGFYKDMSRADAEGIVSLWQEMFTEPYEVVGAAVKALIATDTKGFPPVIGQVKEKIHLLTTPREMTPAEAWSYVSKAIRNSAYHSKEEFEKLPPVVQGVVGSPDQLKAWAGMEESTVQSVEGPVWQRSFREKAAKVKEWQMLPQSAKEMQHQLTAGVAKPMPELPPTDEVERAAMRDDAVRRTRTALEVQDMLEAAFVTDFSNIPLPGKQEPPTEQDMVDFEARRKAAIAALYGK